jgi:hypothetical protein
MRVHLQESNLSKFERLRAQSHAVQIRDDHLLHKQRGKIAQISSIFRRVTLTPEAINLFGLCAYRGRITLIRVENLWLQCVFFRAMKLL